MTVPTAALSSVLLRAEGLRAISPRGLAPLDPATCRFAGRAVTVRYLPLREDRAAALSPYNTEAPFFDAWEQTRPGDVVVIDAAGREDAGILGEMLATRLQRLGAAAVVCDGGMRDVVALRALGMPIVCRGPAPASSTAGLMLVDHGLPVSVGGVTVFPGDWVVGDEDGVVICPAASWEKARAEVANREAIEAYVRLRVEAGEPVRGLYPPTDAVREAFARWQAAGSPPDRLT
jgi:regulator of RNase E activity RraA